MELSGPQQKQLREALLSAFPTRQELERMVFDGLSERLSFRASDDNLDQVMFELLRWAQAQGRLEELIVAAIKENSGNAQLRQVADQLGVRLDQILSPYPATPTLPRIWNIPYPRNPFFTGQEAVLTQLATALKAGEVSALSQPQAITGLGGIGKTQIAVEFAYQHRQEYEAVLWVLADTRESLVSGYIALAQLLELPQKDNQEQAVIVEAVKSWLQIHSSWLLILDNADELAMVREFVPASFGGRILLTTRAQGMGRFAKGIEVETMKEEVGALFLLRRAGIVAEDDPLDAASSSDAVTAREMHGKGDKRGIVKVPVDVVRAIEAYLVATGRKDSVREAPLFVGFNRGDHPTSERVSDKLLERLVKLAGAKIGMNLSPHCLRASFISLTSEGGAARLEQVQYAARHADPRTTKRYRKRKNNLDDNAVDYLKL